jgi:hypothetical protein
MTTSLRILAAFMITSCLTGTIKADEKLAGKACRSVHLGYRNAPEGNAFYNEIRVDKSARGTYFSACGFNHGYYGIQEQGNGKKVVIFSIWDPGNQDDPKTVDPEKRVKLVYKDPQVRTGRFGNEGTGGQSFLDLDWKLGQTYRFLVTSKPAGDRTEFSAFISTPDAKPWRHLVTFSTITKGKQLSGYYSFVEDFRRNKISLTEERRAHYGNTWVRNLKNEWIPIQAAKFTGDSNPSLAIDAGSNEGFFFLATGGEVKNTHVPLNKIIDISPPTKKPEIP